MQRGWGSGSTRTVGQGARLVALVALVGVAALVVLGSIAGTALAKKGSTVWLCKPALENDPCTNPLTTTVINTNGETSLEKAKKASRPPIDCFYVYPTVSEQPTMNANLEIEPQETQIAIDQASRFSQDCRVFAPMYPQLTLKAINEPGGVTLEGEAKAYFGVLDAWHEYLQRYNKGRGVVLIGHSQGSALLIQMIKEAIDPDPSMRHLLVSAVLLGGNVLVPEGKLVGGDFQNIPACQAAYQTHCVIAYSTFLKEPPEGSFFGRPNSPLLGRRTRRHAGPVREPRAVHPERRRHRTPAPVRVHNAVPRSARAVHPDPDRIDAVGGLDRRVHGPVPQPKRRELAAGQPGGHPRRSARIRQGIARA